MSPPYGRPSSSKQKRTRRLFDERQRMVLSGADRDAFLAAIGRKPDPAPRLIAVLRRHRRLFG